MWLRSSKEEKNSNFSNSFDLGLVNYDIDYEDLISLQDP